MKKEAAQRHLGGEKSAEKHAGDEGDRTDRAVDVAHRLIAQAEAALGALFE